MTAQVSFKNIKQSTEHLVCVNYVSLKIGGAVQTENTHLKIMPLMHLTLVMFNLETNSNHH